MYSGPARGIMDSMLTPTVTELTRALEPVSPDTFVDPLPEEPLGGPPAMGRVVNLRPPVAAGPWPDIVARAA
jgi:hypothetical protein